MSYCRNNGIDSDVYVIGNAAGYECCCSPRGIPYKYHHYESSIEMIRHLREHRKRGDKVPERAITRLWNESFILIPDEKQKQTT